MSENVCWLFLFSFRFKKPFQGTLGLFLLLIFVFLREQKLSHPKVCWLFFVFHLCLKGISKAFLTNNTYSLFFTFHFCLKSTKDFPPFFFCSCFCFKSFPTYLLSTKQKPWKNKMEKRFCFLACWLCCMIAFVKKKQRELLWMTEGGVGVGEAKI